MFDNPCSTARKGRGPHSPPSEARIIFRLIPFLNFVACGLFRLRQTGFGDTTRPFCPQKNLQKDLCVPPYPLCISVTLPLYGRRAERG